MNIGIIETRPRPITRTAKMNPTMKAFLAGSLSGTCSTILFQPLDLLKTQMQRDLRPRTPSMLGLTINILKKENMAGLWRGLVPSLARTVPGVGIYFSTMHLIKGKICHGKTGKPSAVVSGGIGFFARCIAASIMIPFTIIKVRKEAGSLGKQGVIEGLFNIYKKEGARGLTAGVIPTLIRDAPFSGIYLMFYENLKTCSSSWFNSDSGDWSRNMVCGLSAGCLASLVTHPADVIKTRVQLKPGETVWATVENIYGRFGMAGFVKGFGPRMLRRSMMASLAWTVYEKAMKNLGIK